MWEADARFRSASLQTIATALDPWQEPAIAAATTGDSQISAQRLLDGPNTLYLIAPAHEQRRLRGLFTALVADIAAGAFERSAQTGSPIDPPLLLALDEAANIAPLPNLDEIASTGPGQGVQLLTVLQNISQASDRWGRDRAETIIANHRARLFCSGIGDRATLDYLRADARRGGDRTHLHPPPRPAARRARAPSSTEFRALAARTASAKDTNTRCSSTVASRPHGWRYARGTRTPRCAQPRKPAPPPGRSAWRPSARWGGCLARVSPPSGGVGGCVSRPT